MLRRALQKSRSMYYESQKIRTGIKLRREKALRRREAVKPHKQQHGAYQSGAKPR